MIDNNVLMNGGMMKSKQLWFLLILAMVGSAHGGMSMSREHQAWLDRIEADKAEHAEKVARDKNRKKLDELDKLIKRGDREQALRVLRSTIHSCEGGDTPLQFAIGRNSEAMFNFIIEFMLQDGYRFVTHGHNDDTPLMTAARNGNISFVRRLLDLTPATSDTSAHRNERGELPIHAAVRSGNKEVVALLLDKGYSINQKQQWKEMVKREYGKQEEVCFTHVPLTIAAECGHVDLFFYLIERGADLEGRIHYRASTFNGNHRYEGAQEIGIRKYCRLHCSYDFLDPFSAMARNDFNRLKRIFEHGLERSNVDENGFTVVGAACRYGKMDVLDYVATQRGESFIRERANNQGDSPLAVAIRFGQKAVVEFLVAHGAILDAPAQSSIKKGTTDNNYQSIHVAAQYNQREVLDYLVTQGCSIQTSTPHGDRAIHIAAEHGSLAAVRWLLEHGATLRDRTNQDKRPIDIAREHKQNAIVDLLTIHHACEQGDLERVKLLLSRGATITDTDEKDFVPLQTAVRYGRSDIVRELVLQGADLTMRDKEGRSLADLAAEYGQTAMLEFLGALEKELAVDEPDEGAVGSSREYVQVDETTPIGSVPHASKKISSASQVPVKSSAKATALLPVELEIDPLTILAELNHILERVRLSHEEGKRALETNTDERIARYVLNGVLAQMRQDGVFDSLMSWRHTYADGLNQAVITHHAEREGFERLAYWLHDQGWLNAEYDVSAHPIIDAIMHHDMSELKRRVRAGAQRRVIAGPQGDRLLHHLARRTDLIWYDEIQEPYLDWIELIVQLQGDFVPHNREGDTPTMTALRSRSPLIKEFLALGQDYYTARDRRGDSLLHLALLLGDEGRITTGLVIDELERLGKLTMLIDMTNNEGLTPLMQAIVSKRWWLVVRLVMAGASMNIISSIHGTVASLLDATTVNEQMALEVLVDEQLHAINRAKSTISSFREAQRDRLLALHNLLLALRGEGSTGILVLSGNDTRHENSSQAVYQCGHPYATMQEGNHWQRRHQPCPACRVHMIEKSLE